MKSGAAAMPIKPGDAVGTRKRGQESDPATHGGADKDQFARCQGVDHGERVGGPGADGAIEEVAAAGTMPGIVEAQHPDTAFRAQKAASAVALSPVMSERKPGRNTIVGPLPCRWIQASSMPLPRSRRPVVSIHVSRIPYKHWSNTDGMAGAR